MNLIWSEEATADRMSIFEYIGADNPVAAEKLDRSIRDRADGLMRLPFLGRPGKRPGTRELTIHSNYRLVYRVAGEVITILGVIHASRNWPEIWERN